MALEQLKALKAGDKVRCFWNHPSGETIDKVETVTVPWSRENDFGEPSALLKTLRITPYNYQHFTIVSKSSETPMTQRLTWHDMKNLKVGDLLRYQRSHGFSDLNPIDTIAVVTTPFGQVFDKQGNVACVVKVHCEPIGRFKLEAVTSHNFHLFTIVSQ